MTFHELTIAQLEADGCIIGIQDGNHGEKHPKANDYVENGIPFIMASDLRDGRVDIESANKLPQEITDRLRIGFCQSGDVLLSHKGSVGYVAIAPECSPYLMLSPQVTYYRVNDEKLSREFLSYAFKEPNFQKRLASAAGQQGTRGYIGIRAQRKLTVRFGDRLLQDRLVGTIKPYDDMIENNRRRIALLEEAARLLYREWFVHFRFPGHEHIKITDGVPEGWELKSLGDLLTLKRGYDLPESKRINGSVPIVSSAGITGFHDKKMADGPGVVTGRYGTIGDVYLIHDDFWPLNTSLYVKDMKESPIIYCFHLLSNALTSIQSEKAAVPGLNRNTLHAMKIAAPPLRLREHFAEIVEPNHKQINVLKMTNQKLAEARDLLLPRLMSGEITV